MPKETSLDDDSAVVVEEPFALSFSVTRRESENAKEDIMEAFRKTIEVASHYQGVEKGVRQVIKALDRSGDVRSGSHVGVVRGEERSFSSCGKRKAVGAVVRFVSL